MKTKRLILNFTLILAFLFFLTMCTTHPLIFLNPEVSIDYISGSVGGNIHFSITFDTNPSSPYEQGATNKMRFNYLLEDLSVHNVTQDKAISCGFEAGNTTTWRLDDTDGASIRLKLSVDTSSDVTAGDTLIIYMSAHVEVFYGDDYDWSNSYQLGVTETYNT